MSRYIPPHLRQQQGGSSSGSGQRSVLGMAAGGRGGKGDGRGGYRSGGKGSKGGGRYHRGGKGGGKGGKGQGGRGAPPPPAHVFLGHTGAEADEQEPLFASPADAPSWLSGGQLRKSAGTFLFRGPSKPALEVYAPKAHPDSRSFHGRYSGDSSSPPLQRPAVLVLPGGGYQAFAPYEGAPAAEWLASACGCVAFVLRYRLPSRHAWPAAEDDLAAALAYLRSDEAEARFGVDRMHAPVVVGFSAGAHLACHLATSRSPVSQSDPDLAFDLVLLYPPSTWTFPSGDAGDEAGEELIVASVVAPAKASAVPAEAAAQAAASSAARSEAIDSAEDGTGGGQAKGQQDGTAAGGVAGFGSTSSTGAGTSSGGGTAPACPRRAYVVASTGDTLLPPESHSDLVVEQLRACGSPGWDVTYQREPLGNHGFGVARRWTTPCAAWLASFLTPPSASS